MSDGDEQPVVDETQPQEEKILVTEEQPVENESNQAIEEGVDEDLIQRIQSVSLSNGTLSCAFREFEQFPETLAERYGALTKRLDLSHNCLKALDHIGKFTALEELILDNNEMEEVMLPQPMPKLHTLSINKNQISNIDALLETLKEAAPNLTYLSLLGNIACPNELVEKEEKDYQRYRYLVLHNIPTLKFLDSRKVTEEESSIAAKQGQFMRAVVMDVNELEQQQKEQNLNHTASQYTPLPEAEHALTDHRGTMGRCKYVYYGRHSEGNRFIRNNDL